MCQTGEIRNMPNQHPQQFELAADFLAFSREKLLEQYWPRLRTCVESLTDEQVWWRPNDASNSVGNLLLHLWSRHCRRRSLLSFPASAKPLTAFSGLPV